MTAGVGPPAVAGERTRMWWDVVRWALLAVWPVVMVFGILTTAHTSTYQRLQSDLDAGLDHVTVGGLAPEPSGEAVQEVRWRSDGVNRKVLVNVVAPQDPAVEGDAFTDDF